MRREFTLTNADRDFLESQNRPWEAILEGQNRWVIIEGFDVPKGYDHEVTLVALLLPAAYPDVQIDMPVETQSTAIQDTTNKPVVAPPPPPAPTHQAVRVAGGPGKNFPSTDDYYPSASARLGESGTATVHVCTDTKGKLTEDPKLETTSGIGRLDEGALKLAKAASGRYKPATEDGNPIASCFGFRIKFQLRN